MKYRFLLVCVLLILAGCSFPASSGGIRYTWDGVNHGEFDIITDMPTFTPTSIDTITPTPTLTFTPVPTDTSTPTQVPTDTPTFTPLPTFTPTFTPLPTFASTPTPTLVTDVSVPYGPFHNSAYTRLFFDGAIIAGNEWERLHEILDANYRILAAAAVSDPCYYYTDPFDANTWDVDAFVADIAARELEIREHFADGTLIGLVELNEPHNPDQDRCVPVPPAKLSEAANAFWAVFESATLNRNTFLFGFWTPPTYLEGVDVSGISLAAIQYTGKGGVPIDQWALPLEQSAASQGIMLIYSANLYQLGVVDTVAANVWECSRPLAAMVTLWTDRYVLDADAGLYQTALDACNP